MKKKLLFTLWALLFILCAGLSFIPNPTGFGRAVLIGTALAFFVPPAVLLYDARKARDARTLRLLRALSLASLLATVAALAANFLSARASVTVGLVLHAILAVVSSPMLCGQIWLLSLFFWACLMVASIGALRDLKAR